MDEITHEDNIKKLIDEIPKDTTPLEKVILANEGTVQTLMSVVFGVPIKIEVLSQIETETYIVRWVRLVADYGNDLSITVCLAESIIDKNIIFNGFLNGVREKNMGIGQLLSACGIRTVRELLGFYSDKNTFSRNYSISTHGYDIKAGRGFKIIITEVFQKDAFKRLESIKS